MKKVYTRTEFEWNGYQYVAVPIAWEDYAGPWEHAKGDATAQAAEKQQAMFNTQLMKIFTQQFGQQQDVLKYLQGKMQPMIDNPTGFSADAEAAMRTGASEQVAGQYQNAAKALANQRAQRGDAGLPSGVDAQIDAQVGNAAAATGAQAQNDITLQNEQLKNANMWNAVNALSGVGAQFNPQSYGSLYNQGAGNVANLSQAYTSSKQSQLMGALGGVLGGGLSGLMGNTALFGKKSGS
jgi:hypothetical protein